MKIINLSKSEKIIHCLKEFHLTEEGMLPIFDIENDDDVKESINNNENTLTWSYKTSALLSEPGLTISEGNLNITTENTGVKDEYLVTLSLNYEGLADLKKASTPNPTEDLIKVSGQNRIIIKNIGTIDSKIAVTFNKL